MKKIYVINKTILEEGNYDNSIKCYATKEKAEQEFNKMVKQFKKYYPASEGFHYDEWDTQITIIKDGYADLRAEIIESELL